MNKYPLWKSLLVIFILLVGLVYAAPNLYGDDPAIQISGTEKQVIDQALQAQVQQILQQGQFTTKSIAVESDNLLMIRFNDTTTQLKAYDYIKAGLSNDGYIVALNLAPATPQWLQALGAHPMKLGLDLRGGVHFLIAVDVAAVINSRVQQDVRSLSDALRNEDIRYASAGLQNKEQILLVFRDKETQQKAEDLIQKQFTDFSVVSSQRGNDYQLILQMTPVALNDVRNYVIEQTMEVLRKRVNALGVSEAIVQRQGAEQIVVDLPGIQDTARAKQILGGTATIELHMVDDTGNINAAVAGQVPVGSKLYAMADTNQPILLKSRVVLSGSAIVGATSSFGDDGRPVVNLRIAGSQVSLFHRITGENVQKQMGIVYIETVPTTQITNGKIVNSSKTIEKVISAPVIQSALGSSFQITGLESAQTARNLALLLRSGALPAALTIVEESTVGPSLGQQNIEKGLMSVEIGFLAIVVFMLLYYRVFGLIANLALAFNLVVMLALLSLLGATLTLPGIAGIVLTVGMAVDANVLIFERIREELRNGLSPQASIHIGYEKALITIVDSNVTTLIVALILFALGSGSVKGFAIILTLGLLTSMFTAITGSRALVHFIYGRRSTKSLSIGIKVPSSIQTPQR